MATNYQGPTSAVINECLCTIPTSQYSPPRSAFALPNQAMTEFETLPRGRTIDAQRRHYNTDILFMPSSNPSHPFQLKALLRAIVEMASNVIWKDNPRWHASLDSPPRGRDTKKSTDEDWKPHEAHIRSWVAGPRPVSDAEIMKRLESRGLTVTYVPLHAALIKRY
jgi:hypothetical protein